MLIGDYDYSDSTVQSRVEWITSSVEKSNEKLNDDLYTDSWLRAFLQFVQSNNELSTNQLDINGMANFTNILKNVIMFMNQYLIN